MSAARPEIGTRPGVGIARAGGPVRRFLALAAGSLAAMLAGSLALGLPAASVIPAAGALGTALVLSARGLRRGHPHARLGAANVITLLRLTIVGVLLAVFLGRVLADGPAGAGAAGAATTVTVVVLSVIALSLDGVDGYLARRQRLTSRFGASFDMEVDSGFALVLSLLAALGPAGPLAVLLGLPRYAFALAGAALPWLNGPLEERVSRKVVCVLQLIALIALQLPLLSAGTALAIVAFTLTLLAVSFGRDIADLARSRPRRSG